MLRPSIFGKSMALDGDKTSTGATCIATVRTAIADNKQMLRVGDPTTKCPQCGKTGKVITGENRVVNHGKAQAVHGSLVQCGCPIGVNFVIASDPVRVEHSIFSNHLSSIASDSKTNSNKDSYRIRYLCQSDDGEILSNSTYYFYLNNGERIVGKTDNDGYTDWCESNEQQKPFFHILKD